MSIPQLFQEFIQSAAGQALQAMFAIALLDLLTGVIAAVRDQTFYVSALGAFISRHLMLRVVPIAVLLVGAYYAGSGSVLVAAIAAAGAYTVETAASLIDNLKTIKDPSTTSSNPVPRG